MFTLQIVSTSKIFFWVFDKNAKKDRFLYHVKCVSVKKIFAPVKKKDFCMKKKISWISLALCNFQKNIYIFNSPWNTLHIPLPTVKLAIRGFVFGFMPIWVFSSWKRADRLEKVVECFSKSSDDIQQENLRIWHTNLDPIRRIWSNIAKTKNEPPPRQFDRW